MANNSTPSQRDALLSEWGRRSRLARMLLPGDLLQESVASGDEILECHRRTLDSVTMEDRVKGRVVKLVEARKYSSDLNYRPQEFKNQSLTLINDAREVDCANCSGSGIVSCPTRMRCRDCGGSGRIRENCSTCGGSGRTGWNNEYNCLGCSDGKREVDCRNCRFGEVVCDRCNGRGYVGCDKCDTEGKLVQANFITRKFSASSKVNYQLSGLDEDKFKNGLEKKHFSSSPGNLIYQEYQAPNGKDTTLERLTIHSYDVLSRQFDYRGNEYFLNSIVANGTQKIVPKGLPLSKPKVAAACASLLTVVAAGLLCLAFLT